VKMDFTSLKFNPQPPSTMTATLRAKLRTDPDFKLKIPVVGTCTMSLDSTKSNKPDVGVALPILARVNGETKQTSIDFDTDNIDLQDIDSGDISIKGGFLCGLTDALKSLILGTLKDQIKKQLAGPLSGVLCQKCESNDDCNSLADQGCAADKKVCMRK